MNISGLAATSQNTLAGRWSAIVVITVRDQNGALLPGATVTGAWSEISGDNISDCTTDSTGTCAVTQWNLKRSGENEVSHTTFSVTNLYHPNFAYNSGANTPTPTEIEVHKP
jgi:hypothetical protein